ncbi:Arm DNA-binding domain-containing protein, partial [Stenotrophomonas maltophilia]|uniref:Arm DNA-binding domain-containing protein n=1 Tax=Stenotrophomonas maltophilia TaxID=40324 RepID=UPI0030F3F6A2
MDSVGSTSRHKSARNCWYGCWYHLTHNAYRDGRRSMALTDFKIRGAKPAEKPYRLSDGGGLFLEIRPNGSKLWRYAYRL